MNLSSLCWIWCWLHCNSSCAVHVQFFTLSHKIFYFILVSNVTNRSQFALDMFICGVPQGSVLAPLLLFICTLTKSWTLINDIKSGKINPVYQSNQMTSHTRCDSNFSAPLWPRVCDRCSEEEGRLSALIELTVLVWQRSLIISFKHLLASSCQLTGATGGWENKDSAALWATQDPLEPGGRQTRAAEFRSSRETQQDQFDNNMNVEDETQNVKCVGASLIWVWYHECDIAQTIRSLHVNSSVALSCDVLV